MNSLKCENVYQVPHSSDEEYYMLYCFQLQEVVGALENRVTIITNYNLV